MYKLYILFVLAIIGFNCCTEKGVKKETIYLLLSQERGIPIPVEDTNINDPKKPSLGDHEIFKIKIDTNGKIYCFRGWGNIQGKQLYYKGTFDEKVISLNAKELDSVMSWSQELKKDGSYETTNSANDTWLINMNIDSLQRIFYRQELMKNNHIGNTQNKLINLLFDKIKYLNSDI